MPTGLALPTQPATFAALQAMRSIILAECLVGGISPFAALSSADVARYGVSNAVFVGRPKDFSDAYLPQCSLWLPPDSEEVTLDGSSGRAEAWVEVIVRVLVDQRTDWYLGEQRMLGIRDALWPALLRHERLGGTVATVTQAEARPGRGLCYVEIAGVEYRAFEALWGFRQEWQASGGRVV
ncbi:MAG TPA: hypothetical protein VF807_02455 [Ktedonobacterales bacterium]